MSLFPKALTPPALLKAATDLKIVRFGMVGVVNTTIDLVLFTLLVQGAKMPVVPANMLSYSTGILNSFIMNRAWTFNHRARGKAFWRSLLLFIGINLLGLLFSTLLVALFSKLMAPVIAKVLSVPLVFIWNFLASRYLAFGGGQDLATARG